MALRTSHSSENRVVDSGLVVTYSVVKVNGTWSYTSANVEGWYYYMWELHRRARKSYRYVGMTETAARACKAAMIALYTRTVQQSFWNGDTMGGGWTVGSGGEMPMAEIAMSHNDDGSYDVVVNVNEDDCRMAMANSSPPAFAVAFSTERLTRNYDGETEVEEEET